MSASKQPDDYSSLAAFYDLIYAQVGPDDVAFYLDHAARQTGPVLELGCGTGRITLPLARAGHSVTALDLSPAMLEQLRIKLALESAEVQSRVELIQGDMAQFELRSGGDPPLYRQFGLIIAPFRAFQHLMEVDQQRSFLTRVRDHLAPGGVYIHDQFEPNYAKIISNMQRGAAPQLDTEISLPDGGLLQRHVVLQYDLGCQRVDAQFRIEEYGADGTLHRTTLERVALRMTHRQEILYFLELCGLRVTEAFDGYHGEPLGNAIARYLVLVCQRA